MDNSRIAHSSIIDPKTYSRQHPYLGESDDKLGEAVIKAWRRLGGFTPGTGTTFMISGHHSPPEPKPPKMEIVELGCGPGRTSWQFHQLPNTTYTGVDCDFKFLRDAKKNNPDMTFEFGDVTQYQHPCPVNIFFSQRMHCHIPKGKNTAKYLKKVWDALKPGGVYIICDEFLEEYCDHEERRRNSVIWHSHVISKAMYYGHYVLAMEEAKTLLDDLDLTDEGKNFENFPESTLKKLEQNFKNFEQILEILKRAPHINATTQFKECYPKGKAKREITRLLSKLRSIETTTPSNDSHIRLSQPQRHFKICDSVFREEVTAADFVAEFSHYVGPLCSIVGSPVGGFRIYTLRKPA